MFKVRYAEKKKLKIRKCDVSIAKATDEAKMLLGRSPKARVDGEASFENVRR